MLGTPIIGSPTMHNTPPTPLAAAEAQVQALQQRLSTAQLAFRDPPAHPTTCCGRGCNGCVWEGYFGAVAWWLEDAQQALVNGANPPPAG